MTITCPVCVPLMLGNPTTGAAVVGGGVVVAAPVVAGASVALVAPVVGVAAELAGAADVAVPPATVVAVVVTVAAAVVGVALLPLLLQATAVQAIAIVAAMYVAREDLLTVSPSVVIRGDYPRTPLDIVERGRSCQNLTIVSSPRARSLNIVEQISDGELNAVDLRAAWRYVHSLAECTVAFARAFGGQA